jgi:hypothetical protein
MQKAIAQFSVTKESKILTPKKNIEDKLNPNKSPIKTPRSVNKFASPLFTNKQRTLEAQKNKDKPIQPENKFKEIKARKKEDGELQEQNKIVNFREEEKEKNKNKEQKYPKKTPVGEILAPIPLIFHENKNSELKNESFQIKEEQEHIFENTDKSKKKNWKSWSSQEKVLFYEAIANGANYSSLQKLFKNMNYVIIKSN